MSLKKKEGTDKLSNMFDYIAKNYTSSTGFEKWIKDNSRENYTIEEKQPSPLQGKQGWTRKEIKSKNTM